MSPERRNSLLAHRQTQRRGWTDPFVLDAVICFGADARLYGPAAERLASVEGGLGRIDAGNDFGEYGLGGSLVELLFAIGGSPWGHLQEFYKPWGLLGKQIRRSPRFISQGRNSRTRW
jgi:hypothetical protein